MIRRTQTSPLRSHSLLYKGWSWYVISLTLKASSTSIRCKIRAPVSSRTRKTTKQLVQLHIASGVLSFLARIPVSSRLQDLLAEHQARDMNTLTISRDVQKGQERMKETPKEKQIPVNKKSSLDDLQNILSKYCTGSPKLQHLLLILAKAVVLRKGKVFAVGELPISSRVAREGKLLRFLTPPDDQLICGCRSWLVVVSTLRVYGQVRKAKQDSR
jgi:hypothetical protein